MGFFSSVSSALSGDNIVGSLPYVGANYWSNQNLKFQQSNLDWQKYAQMQTWQREDNAIQRRVADLKGAGLSPVLAAGQGASSGPVVSTQAPQRNTQGTNMLDAAQAVMALITQKKNIEVQESQKKLMQLQGQQATANSLEALARIQKIPSEIDRNVAAAGMARAGASDHLSSARERIHNLRISSQAGQPTHPGFWGDFIRAANGANEESLNVQARQIDSMEPDQRFRFLQFMRTYHQSNFRDFWNRISPETRSSYNQIYRSRGSR